MATVSPPTLSSSPANQQEPWYEDDSVVTLVPKFKVKDGMMEQFTALLPKFIELVKVNEGGACVHYGFVSCDDIIPPRSSSFFAVWYQPLLIESRLRGRRRRRRTPRRRSMWRFPAAAGRAVRGWLRDMPGGVRLRRRCAEAPRQRHGCAERGVAGEDIRSRGSLHVSRSLFVVKSGDNVLSMLDLHPA